MDKNQTQLDTIQSKGSRLVTSVLHFSIFDDEDMYHMMFWISQNVQLNEIYNFRYNDVPGIFLHILQLWRFLDM